MLPVTRPHTPIALSHQIVEHLCEDLREQRLRVGDRLPIEPALAQRFGVSRTVVREAIQRLQAMGLVETRHGVGSFVREATPNPPATGALGLLHAPRSAQQMLAMLELRIAVETEAAALAATRRTDAQLVQMRAALDAFDQAVAAGTSTLHADFQFHRLMAEATGNTYFEQVLDSLGRHALSAPGSWPTPSPTQFSDTQEPRLLQGKALTAHEHEAVYAALCRSDAMGARAAMLVHLGNSRERLRRAWALT